MILLDTNLLVYVFTTSMPEHQKADAWLNDQLRSGTQVAIPWEAATGFVRLVSNPRIFPKPASVAAAWKQVEEWLAEPNVWVPVPNPQHRQIVRELIAAKTFATNDVPDIHLAALAISHGLKLASHDQGFARFEGLRWIDPLAS